MDRSIAIQTKAGKDRQQAGEMIEVPMQYRPGDIDLAVASTNRRNKLRDGLNLLPAKLADEQRKIMAMLAD